MENKSPETVINLLRGANIKEVERQTGIPADRMYKWIKGKGSPKVGDLFTLFGYFNNILDFEPAKNVTSSNTSASNGSQNKQSRPRLEAKPLSLMFNADDFETLGTKFQELPDGTLNMIVSVVPARGYAGYLRGFPDPEYYEGLETISVSVLKQHSGHYLAFEVSGDSMTTLEPEYFRESIFDGSIVVGRELAKHHWKYKLHTHNFDAWVIVHKTEGILIKKIIKHDVKEGNITIHSLNPDKNEYPDQELHLDDIEQIFNIVQIVNKR